MFIKFCVLESDLWLNVDEYRGSTFAYISSMYCESLAGTNDSSGMRLWYTDTPREHEAELLAVGYRVTPLMVIPPNSKNFTITGLVNEECTNQVRYNNFLHETGP